MMVEFERLFCIDGIEKVSYHWGVFEVPFRVKGDFNIWVGFFPLVITQEPINLTYDPSYLSLFVIPGIKSAIAFHII